MVFLFWYFLMRKELFIFNFKTEEKVDPIQSWTNTQGWIFVIFTPIFVIFSLYEKWLPISMLLEYLDISLCGS